MKKKFTAFLLIIMTVMMCAFPSIEAEAYDDEKYFDYGNFYCHLLYGKVSIQKYKGSETFVKVPAVIEGCPVYYISGQSFYNCTTIKSVKLPETITGIGENAFMMCTNLETINLPNSITDVGFLAFARCDKLKTINIPTSLHSFWASSFAYSGIEYVTIPGSIGYINPDLFSDCNNLEKVVINDGLEEIKSGAFQNCNSLHWVTIPDSVTKIADDAFKNSNNVVFKCNKNSFAAEYAAKHNIECVAIDAPEKPEFSFYNNAVIGYNGTSKNVVIPETIDGEQVLRIGSGAFSGNHDITSVELPQTITSIKEEAFYDCTSLSSINIPESVIWIKKNAFNNCTSLTSLNIPETVSTIEEGAFDGTMWLKSYIYEFVIVGDNILLRYNGSDSSVVIPNTVTKIADGAFKDCDFIQEITIPDSVKTISLSAFGENKNIVINCFRKSTALNFAIDNGYKYNIINGENSKKFLYNQFIKGYEISHYNSEDKESDIVIPEGVDGNHIISIKDKAFANMDYLNSIYIPSSVTSIGENTFEGCPNLTIKCAEGSYAHQYAQEKGISFELVEDVMNNNRIIALCGDLDGDKAITSADSLSALRMSVNLIKINEQNILLADVDSDGVVTSADALDILRFSVQLSKNEKIGKTAEKITQ